VVVREKAVILITVIFMTLIWKKN